MISEVPNVNWKDILDKFSSYEGTIVEFCKQNNIKPHQLYYQRKRSENAPAPVFHAVRFREKIVMKLLKKLSQPTPIRDQL